MKFICAAFALTLCVQTVVSEENLPMPGNMDSDWISWAGKFEGDIALTPEQEREIANGTERNAIRSKAGKWPNGQVPYVFTSVFRESEKNVIRQAFADYAAKTCIRFVERNGEANYINFVKEGGCWSYVGRTGGKQKVSLAAGCVHKATVIHELMHAIGFYHEQSRYDRDQYVRVNTNNARCCTRNFDAQSSNKIQHLGEPYDYKSVMHYGEYAFSRQRGVLKTIEALDGTSPLGNNVGFSQIDINKINKLYCEPTTPGPSSNCEDKFGSNCNRWKNQNACNDKEYRNFMMDSCPKTCGFCAADACFDRHLVICGPWARAGACNSGGASVTAWMEEFCPKSCNSC